MRLTVGELTLIAPMIAVIGSVLGAIVGAHLVGRTARQEEAYKRLWEWEKTTYDTAMFNARVAVERRRNTMRYLRLASDNEKTYDTPLDEVEYIKLLTRMGIVARSEIRQLFEDFWQAEVGWTSEHIALTEAQKDAADVAHGMRSADDGESFARTKIYKERRQKAYDDAETCFKRLEKAVYDEVHRHTRGIH